ncbi:MAG: hypothetical protein KDB58_07245 [Solirubrobacterales bacterium]|nr:hypothetical protein [Solirubrobacterales bacterium]MCB8970284.1 hypothetical protein [Thermoleophilales bacterium]MCB9617786.1 hypothetical protein [Sandaracinus sp.]
MSARLNNPQRVRVEVFKLERLLSNATSSLDRQPILEALAERRRQLREHGAYLRTLRRVDVSNEENADRLFGTGVHAPLEEK